MRTLFVSDIHGSATALDGILRIFDAEQCDLLCLLGDVLNYGPRNGLPEGLDPQAVAERLNALADRIVAVRGNCDSEVDQMLLRFPMMADYAMLVDGGRRFFLTHGHRYSPEALPALAVDVVVCGHTHLPRLERLESGLVCCNLGSPTFPKGGNPPTFATLEDGLLELRHADGRTLSSLRL